MNSSGSVVLAWVILLVWLGTWAGLIWWTVSIAKSKGRSAAAWGVLAFFFGLLALVAVALAGRVGPDPRYRVCPSCMNNIARQATVCGYCGQPVRPILEYQRHQRSG